MCLLARRVLSRIMLTLAIVAVLAAGPGRVLASTGVLLSRVHRVLARVPPGPVALLLAAIVLAVGLHWNTRTAAGSDSYGYVSQAELWLKGDLTIEQPWVASVPWPDKGWSFSPLGYMPRGIRSGSGIVDDESTIVPTYSAGVSCSSGGSISSTSTSITGSACGFSCLSGHS